MVQVMQSGRSSRANTAVDAATAACFFRLGAIVLAGVIFASLVDAADFAIMLATFLSVSGTLRGTAAAIAADESWAREMNCWDEAAMLIFLGMIAYWVGT